MNQNNGCTFITSASDQTSIIELSAAWVILYSDPKGSLLLTRKGFGHEAYDSNQCIPVGLIG